MALTTVSIFRDELTADPARWRESASCTSVDDYFFFAPEGETDRARYIRESIARGICGTCSALDHCRRYSLETAQPYGVWGVDRMGTQRGSRSIQRNSRMNEYGSHRLAGSPFRVRMGGTQRRRRLASDLFSRISSSRGGGPSVRPVGGLRFPAANWSGQAAPGPV
ncbi:WhiB family transcriptional regulator [Rhodococcus jostii]|uniref:WhiB family transcriptional regulator n=1 Tax=Rhodococcus jostii TaxID=132919 RepID=UPI0036421E83